MTFDFGVRLKNIRMQRKISQKTLGLKINKSANVIWRMEAGIQTPTYDDIKLLSEILNVPYSYWFDGNRADYLNLSQTEIINSLRSDFKKMRDIPKNVRVEKLVELCEKIKAEYYLENSDESEESEEE